MRGSETYHNNTSLVGLVGNAACGKDTVGESFKNFGFIHQSLSDILREEIRARNLEPTRELQTQIANELRRSRGGSYFVEQALQRATQHIMYKGHVVVSGLYAPSEGLYLKQKGGYIVGVLGDIHESLISRYNRVVHRASGNQDNLNFDDFVAAYYRENQGTEAHEANIDSLLSISDFTINHNGTSAQIMPAIMNVIGAINEKS